MSSTKKTTKPGRGGAREGAGRKRMYGEPMTEAFTARVNDEQGHAIGEWCRKHKVAPATLLREVGLSSAGAARLGSGVAKMRKTTSAPPLDGAACFPVKMTARQAAAVRRFCVAKGVAPGTWLKEATLAYIGKPELGLRGQSSALESALDS